MKNNEKQAQENPGTENLQLEGRNAVLEAINRGRSIDRLYVKSGEKEGTIRVIIAKAREAGIVISEVSREKLDAMSQTKNHQGVIAVCPAHEYAEVGDILSLAESRGEDPFVIILDNINDPHNLGAIIRSAEAAGAHGIIIPKRRSVGVTGTVAKASAGAVEHLPVARVTNISNTIEELKKHGLWVCAAEAGGRSLYEASLTGPLAVVIGSEGFGVSRLVTEKCDFTVSIPLYGKISSLNASVAAAVIMFEAARARAGVERGSKP